MSTFHLANDQIERSADEIANHDQAARYADAHLERLASCLGRAAGLRLSFVRCMSLKIAHSGHVVAWPCIGWVDSFLEENARALKIMRRFTAVFLQYATLN